VEVSAYMFMRGSHGRGDGGDEVACVYREREGERIRKLLWLPEEA
jgi:hypothetical protein